MYDFFPFFILFPLKAKMHKLHKNSGGGGISSRRVGRYVLCGFFWWMVILWIHKALKNIKKPKKLEKKVIQLWHFGKTISFPKNPFFFRFFKAKEKKTEDLVILSLCSILSSLFSSFLYFVDAHWFSKIH